MTAKGRPLFLKMVYHGPKAMEELVHYDPHLVVGILGGSAGTTYDAFKLLSEAKKYGARVALFGRKINNAENQLAFIRFLRLIADGEIARGGGGAGVSRRPAEARRQAAALAGRRHEAANQRDELRRQRQDDQRPAGGEWTGEWREARGVCLSVRGEEGEWLVLLHAARETSHDER